MVIGHIKNKENKMKAFKKYITILAAAPMLWACSADEGREPGTDPNPAVTLYTYEPAGDYNPDNDVTVRFVTNNKTSSVKYLVLPSQEAEATVKNGGEAALLSKVESEGQTVSNLSGNSYADVTITDLHGDYTIAAVANGSVLANRVTFFGLDWNSVKTGVFYYGAVGSNIAPSEAVEASLEICTSDDSLYRINGAFGEGTAVKMYMLDNMGEDEFGEYRMFRVRPTATPWTYGNYGQVSIRDIGYWQGNESFATNPSYCCGMYEDGYAFFCIQWYVAAGNLGYNYSEFVPYD